MGSRDDIWVRLRRTGAVDAWSTTADRADGTDVPLRLLVPGAGRSLVARLIGFGFGALAMVALAIALLLPNPRSGIALVVSVVAVLVSLIAVLVHALLIPNRRPFVTYEWVARD